MFQLVPVGQAAIVTLVDAVDAFVKNSIAPFSRQIISQIIACYFRIDPSVYALHSHAATYRQTSAGRQPHQDEHQCDRLECAVRYALFAGSKNSVSHDVRLLWLEYFRRSFDEEVNWFGHTLWCPIITSQNRDRRKCARAREVRKWAQQRKSFAWTYHGFVSNYRQLVRDSII